MSSFYGGKQGRTYHIVARYDCVDLTNYETDTTVFEDFHAGTSYTKGKKIKNNGEYYVVLADSISTVNDLTDEEKVYHVRGMVQQFAKGGAYTEANYGEYVLIDTIFNLNHKSDLENGLLYRRGFDYNQALNDKPKKQNYIINQIFDKDLWQAAWDAWVQKPGAGAIYVGQIVGPQGDSPEITPVKWGDIVNKSLVEVKKVIPVSTTMGNDNTLITDDDGHTIWNGDAIKVASLTEKDDDGNVTGAQIAFDIPQTVFDPPSINLNGATYQGAVVEDTESENHPFYYKWNFYIPQATDFAKEKGSQIPSSKYPMDGQGNSIVETDEYITYKVHNANAAGAVQEHLGRWPYRVIDDITLSNHDRTFITFQTDVFAKIGDLYNFNVTSSVGNLVCGICISAGTINHSQLPLIKNEGDDSAYTLGTQSWSGDSQWRVIELPLAAPASSMIVRYKAGEDTQFRDQLQNIDYFTADAKGKIYVKYSNSDKQYYITTIKGLQQVVLDYDGLHVTYTDGIPSFYPVKQINTIELQNKDNIQLSQNLVVKYKDKSFQNVASDLNTILAIEMQGDNIVVLYSDPTYRNNFSQNSNNKKGKDWFLRPWTDPTTGKSYKDLVWINLTSPKGSYHVQGEYTYNDLKTTLKYGFAGQPATVLGLKDREGWLVTVQDGTTKRIYAFDQNDTTPGKYTFPDGTATHWYEIFSLSASQIEPELSVTVESASNPPTNKLNDNGLWFMTYFGHDRI